MSHNQHNNIQLTHIQQTLIKCLRKSMPKKQNEPNLCFKSNKDKLSEITKRINDQIKEKKTKTHTTHIQHTYNGIDDFNKHTYNTHQHTNTHTNTPTQRVTEIEEK